MRMSRLFGQTLRNAPSQTDILSQQLLIRAGYILPEASGRISYLPLGFRTLRNIISQLEDQLTDLGFQQIRLPMIPSDVRKGRNAETTPAENLITDLNDYQYVEPGLKGDTAITNLVRSQIRSYKQLPQAVFYQKIRRRNQPHLKTGLSFTDEYLCLDCFSLSTTNDELEEKVLGLQGLLFNFFNTLEIPHVLTGAGDSGKRTPESYEVVFLTPNGEELIALCSQCDYKSRRQFARFKKPAPPEEENYEAEKVATLNCKTISELAAYLNVPQSKTAKVVFLMAAIPSGEQLVEKLVIAVIRGDMEVSTAKLGQILGSVSMRQATEEEITAVGAVPGYGSPIGTKNALVVADDQIPLSRNLAAGANELGFHFLNVNYERDFRADLVADIALAHEGDQCVECGSTMTFTRGMICAEFGRWGPEISEQMGCNYLDDQGRSRPVLIGSFRLGLDNLLACMAETHHDASGLALPKIAVPFQIHLVLLSGKDSDSSVNEMAQRIYCDLEKENLSVLFDDRSVTPGVKFNDADLIGLPIRLTISERGLMLVDLN